MESKAVKFCFLHLLLFLLYQVSAQIPSLSSEKEEEIQRSDFPPVFLFGTSTSSYQIEGAHLDDGRGISNWDVFSHIPGNVKNNDTGDVADDHYHRYLEDIDLMHSLGVNAYRFSISWTRILPRGRLGDVNPRGILFYNKILDYLVFKGIEPLVTIHHHDMPHELENRQGGWLNPKIQLDYVHFAQICFKEFGDKVKYWTTINAPYYHVKMAYFIGIYPPGRCSPPFENCAAGNSDVEPLIVMHNMLLSHAKTVHLYRTQFQAKQGGSIGIITNSFMYEPLRDEEADREAAKRALAYEVAWTLEPLVYGEYPAEMRQCLGKQLPKFSASEKRLIRDSLDFIGINHYSTLYVKDCLHSSCPNGGDRPITGFVHTIGFRDGVPIGEQTGVDTIFVVPRGLEKIIDYIKKRYHNKPIFVTENGYPTPLQQTENLQDMLQDLNRIKYHKRYLAALARAISNGADVHGYFIWSLMDNFEWADGYRVKFGIYYVDRHTLERIPKLSAKWFASFLTNSGGLQNVLSFRTKNLTNAGLEARNS